MNAEECKAVQAVLEKPITQILQRAMAVRQLIRLHLYMAFRE